MTFFEKRTDVRYHVGRTSKIIEKNYLFRRTIQDVPRAMCKLGAFWVCFLQLVSIGVHTGACANNGGTWRLTNVLD